MKIHTITVTGADESVRPAALLEIAEEFPCVEFGILLSRSSMGRSRFPAKPWLKELMALPDTFKLSGHLCGSWVREVLMGQWPVDDLSAILGPKFFERFARWQLNTHGQRHNWSQEFFGSIQHGPRGVIFQNDGKHNDLLEAARGAGNVAALFDLSHGAGVLPDEWPMPLDGMPCGYAGGLSPVNVAWECSRIADRQSGAEIWIDAETHLREPESVFDLARVRDFITSALPWTFPPAGESEE